MAFATTQTSHASSPEVPTAHPVPSWVIILFFVWLTTILIQTWYRYTEWQDYAQRMHLARCWSISKIKEKK
jgi:hypothetical protein